MFDSSQQHAIKVAKKVFASLTISAGQTEQQVADYICHHLRANEARHAFQVLVASGKRSYLPHGHPTAKKIKKGELVFVDFGAVYNGYRSDITRTYVIGKPTAQQKKIIKIVKEAQRRAICVVKAGVPCYMVDHAARQYIEQQGYGKYFTHSTGHGIGRRVHQAPKIGRKNRRRLKAGMVITIEPGIYIKGWGGVRIEDMVLVTKSGCRVLT